MRLLYALIAAMLVAMIVGSCQNTSGNVSASIGPFDLTLSMTSDGRIYVSGGFSPKATVALGPVRLNLGVQQTYELTQQKPFYLFVVYESTDGRVWRDEYEIGKKFSVKFDRQDWVEEIKGNNDSIIVAVKREVTSDSQPSNPLPSQPQPGSSCGTAPIPRLTIGGEAYCSISPSKRNNVRARPGLSSQYLDQIKPGEALDVLEGPICANEMWWWKIRSRSSGLTGWTSEGDSTNYWLVPQ